MFLAKLRPLWLRWFFIKLWTNQYFETPSFQAHTYDIDRPYITVAKLHFGGNTQSYSLPLSNAYPCRVACEPQMHFWSSLLSLQQMKLETRAKKTWCSCRLVNNKLIQRYMFHMFYIPIMAYFRKKNSNNFLIGGIMVSYWSFKYWSKHYRIGMITKV